MLKRREFADALRQCDGGQIRALVVTRDDFWMGVTVLLRRLELPLQEGRNIASVDLIDPPHARRMLESIGRAVGTLPSDPEPLTSQQQQFIRQAVDELAIGESVIAVHLVIFGQIVKLREWTPRALRNSGGVTGACSLYFQELFGSRTTAGFRSPEYRRIAPAVIPILSALLPTDDGSVLDSSKTESELRSEAHLSRCEHVFKDCLRVLSEDLRIIAVMDSDSDGQIDEQPPLAEISETDVSGCELRYRLSHDFLAEPIADRIDRIRKRSWRGRKLARLSEISEAWGRRPSHVYMPGFFEYCTLVAASRFGGRNRGEAEFIRSDQASFGTYFRRCDRTVGIHGNDGSRLLPAWPSARRTGTSRRVKSRLTAERTGRRRDGTY